MKRLLCTILAAVAMSATTVNAVAQKPDLLEIIEMTGEIHEGSARAIAEQVEAINETPKVKAVLLVVEPDRRKTLGFIALALAKGSIALTG
jgi:predicted Zn-ribbon and HTH transcriptional regulator